MGANNEHNVCKRVHMHGTFDDSHYEQDTIHTQRVIEVVSIEHRIEE